MDGINVPEKTPLTVGFDPLETAENVLVASGISIHEGGTQAFYRPSTDEITLPDRERFTSANDFYATAFHEISHTTKATHRCDRKPYETNIPNGGYSWEECVAEQSCAYCMAWLGW